MPVNMVQLQQRDITFITIMRYYAIFFISLASPSNESRQGISSPPCGKSEKYRPLSVTQQRITPLLMKSEQTREIRRGTNNSSFTHHSYSIGISSIPALPLTLQLFTNCRFTVFFVYVIPSNTRSLLKGLSPEFWSGKFWSGGPKFSVENWSGRTDFSGKMVRLWKIGPGPPPSRAHQDCH